MYSAPGNGQSGSCIEEQYRKGKGFCLPSACKGVNVSHLNGDDDDDDGDDDDGDDDDGDDNDGSWRLVLMENLPRARAYFNCFYILIYLILLILIRREQLLSSLLQMRKLRHRVVEKWPKSLY